MKIVHLLFVVGAVALGACKSGNISSNEVPSVVQNTLRGKTSAEKKVEWKKIQNRYEAEVKINDSTEVTMLIDESGKLVMQKQDIATAEVPAPISTALQNSFGGFVIDDAEKLQKDGVTYYQLEIEKENKEQKLILTADGKEEKGLKFWD